MGESEGLNTQAHSGATKTPTMDFIDPYKTAQPPSFRVGLWH